MDTQILPPGIARIKGESNPQTAHTVEQEIALTKDHDQIEHAINASAQKHAEFEKSARAAQHAEAARRHPLNSLIQKRLISKQRIALAETQKKTVLGVREESTALLNSIFADERYVGRGIAFNHPAQNLAAINETLKALEAWLSAREGELKLLDSEIRNLAKELDLEKLIPRDMFNFVPAIKTASGTVFISSRPEEGHGEIEKANSITGERVRGWARDGVFYETLTEVARQIILLNADNEVK